MAGSQAGPSFILKSAPAHLPFHATLCDRLIYLPLSNLFLRFMYPSARLVVKSPAQQTMSLLILANTLYLPSNCRALLASLLVYHISSDGRWVGVDPNLELPLCC